MSPLGIHVTYSLFRNVAWARGWGVVLIIKYVLLFSLRGIL